MKLELEAAVLEEELLRLISENLRTALDQNEYDQKYGTLYGSYSQKLGRVEKIEGEIGDEEALGECIRKCIGSLMDADGEQTVFDEQLWGGIVEYVTVSRRIRLCSPS